MAVLKRASWSVLGIVVLALPLVAGDTLLSIAITAFLWAYLASAWNLTFGYLGRMSLGHGAFYGLGAYTTVMLAVKTGLTPYIGMLVGALVAALFSLLLGMVTIRYRVKGVYFALVTLAAAELLRSVFNSWSWVGGPIGQLLSPLADPANFVFQSRIPYYYIAVGMTIGIYFLHRYLWTTRIGLEAFALREDEEAAEAAGVNTNRVQLTFILLSAALTAVGGTFYAQYMLYIQPDIVFTFEPTLNMMLGAIIGGATTFAGPILGALLLQGLDAFLRSTFSGVLAAALAKTFYGIVLVIVMVRLPDGLLGAWENWQYRKRRGTGAGTQTSQDLADEEVEARGTAAT